MVEIEVRGVNRVRNSLRKVVGQVPETVDATMREWAESTRLKLKAKPYPPIRPGQTYKRTGRLKNSFRKVRKKPMVWAFTNAAAKNGRVYSHYVIDKDKQAGIHRGRWWTIREVINKEMTPGLTRKLTSELQVMINKNA